MKKETEPFSNVNYLLGIGFTAFIMCLLSCSYVKKLEKNVDNNYRAKNGLPIKTDTKKVEIVKY